MGGLAQRVTLWHRKIITELEEAEPGEKIPINEPVDTLGEGLYHAWLAMEGKSFSVIQRKAKNRLNLRSESDYSYGCRRRKPESTGSKIY